MPIRNLLSQMTVTLSVSACLIVAAPALSSAAEANSGPVAQRNQQPAPAPSNWMSWSASRARPYQPGVSWSPIRDKVCQLRSTDGKHCLKWR